MRVRPETGGPRRGRAWGRRPFAAALAAAAGTLVLASSAHAAQLTVSITAGTGTITVDGGTPCVREDTGAEPTVCAFTVEETADIGLLATFDEDRAVRWADPATCGTQDVCTIPAGNGDRHASLAFEPGPANLTIVPNLIGSVGIDPPGTPRGSAPGESCPAPFEQPNQCSYDFPRGTTVTLTPLPAANAGSLVGWSPFECEGLLVCRLTLDEGQTTVAVGYSVLRLAIARTAGVTVTGTAGGVPVDCSVDMSCQSDVPYGAVATLTGTPDPNDPRPVHWFRGCEEGDDHVGPTCTANVTLNPWWVSVGLEGDDQPASPPLQRVSFRVRKSGQGTVRASQLDCGRICSKTYDYATLLTLVADADPGWAFDHWVHGCGEKTTCRLTLGPTTTVRAVFSARSSAASVPPAPAAQSAPPAPPQPKPGPQPRPRSQALLSSLKAKVAGHGSKRRLLLTFTLSRRSHVRAGLRRSGARRPAATWPSRTMHAGRRSLRLKVPRKLRGTYKLTIRATAGPTVSSTTIRVRMRR